MGDTREREVKIMVTMLFCLMEPTLMYLLFFVLHLFFRLCMLEFVLNLGNGNATEWSAIKGVIGQSNYKQH